MQFLNHDFYSNFEGGVKSGDVDLTIDLWVNEVSDIIMSDAGKVISLLNKVGIKTEQDVSDEEIVENIMDNIGNNSQLNKGISFLIGEFNGIMKNDKNWKQKIDNITATYKVLLDKALKNPTTSGSIKNDIMKQIKAKADSKGDYKRIIFKQEPPVAAKKETKKKKTYYVVGTLLVLGVIGLTVYLYKKNKKAQLLKLADGGGLPTPSITDGLNTGATIPAPIMNTPAPVISASNFNASVTPTASVSTPAPVNVTPKSNLNMV
jgi:hypothetical protein